jgi:hypothetical protein
MKINSINRSFFGLTFVVLGLLASVACAKELKSDELNYVITIPDDWTVIFQNQAGFSTGSQDKKKTMTLLIQEANFATLDSNSIATLEQDFIKVGCTKVSSRSFSIDGILAYEIVQSMGKIPFASSYVDHIVIANKKLYNLEALHIGGDVVQDSDVQEGLASFHFLQPPKTTKFFQFWKTWFSWNNVGISGNRYSRNGFFSDSKSKGVGTRTVSHQADGLFYSSAMIWRNIS